MIAIFPKRTGFNYYYIIIMNHVFQLYLISDVQRNSCLTETTYNLFNF